MSHYVPLIDVVRGDLVESQHFGSVAYIGKSGNLEAALGSVNVPMYPRSTVKLMQTAGMVELGLDLEPRLLALVASSHSGGDVHIAAVQEILAKFTLTDAALKCTPFMPSGEAERALHKKRDGKPDSLHADCSGKHSGFLATCVINGWPLDNYLSPEHPLQIAMKKAIEDASGDIADHVTVDGCGAPLWSISLAGLARSYHRAMIETDSALHRVADAMRTFPEMVAGPRREATVVMQAVAGVVAKDGADGVFVAAQSDGRSVAIKIADGGRRGLTASVAALLDAWGANDVSQLPLTPPQGAGRTVGELVATHDFRAAIAG
ncbi:MAG: hypothetical protein RL410_912 [Actinomycetota bacterium]